ncbi:hypothetical protein Q7P35_005836 [Cladosporium inversicolor]
MWSLLLLCFALTATAQTAAWNASTAATFVFGPPSTGQRFVFALNAVEATGDLYFHMEVPEGQAWGAVGIGSRMKDALIFAAYASENGTGVTISPRITTRHAEPSYAKDIKLEQLWPSELNNSNTIGVNNRLQADAVCRNCTSWLSGKGHLDLKSTSAPFIFAIGPEKTMRSSSLTASMRRHEYYGRFDMNMTAATSPEKGAVPPPFGKNGGYINQDASVVLEMTTDGSKAPAAHALIMIFAFVFLFPLGSLLISVLHKALWHGAVQVLALLMVVTGFGLGIYLSTQYNKSKSFASAHQLIGLLILIAMLLQLGLGLLHHRTRKQTKSPTKFSKIHKFLGPAIFLLGLINGGLGFSFAGNSSYHGRYIVVILTVAVFYFGVRGLAWWWAGRKKERKQREWVGEGFQHPQFGPQEPYPGGPAVPLGDLPGRG